MTSTKWMMGTAMTLLVASSILLSGCGDKGADSDQAKKTADGKDVQAVANADPSHGGWWCVEHGVPEEICTRCSTNLAAEFQKKGDWCKEHNRPESQCFICHPELEAKFAAQYEAKTGHKPPKPEEE
ncbi:MAG: hypothetical protein KDA84_14385 [Planctomycetaceae bacterium]|nr:hypothetical protein [Planctomycetaceae bacterium]